MNLKSDLIMVSRSVRNYCLSDCRASRLFLCRCRRQAGINWWKAYDGKHEITNIILMREAQKQQVSFRGGELPITWSLQAEVESSVKCEGRYQRTYFFTGRARWFLSRLMHQRRKDGPRPHLPCCMMLPVSSHGQKSVGQLPKLPRTCWATAPEMSLCGKGTTRDQCSYDVRYSLGTTKQWVQV